jgi:hypothetical protein
MFQKHCIFLGTFSSNWSCLFLGLLSHKVISWACIVFFICPYRVVSGKFGFICLWNSGFYLVSTFGDTFCPWESDNGTSKRENEGNHYNFVFGMTLVIFLTWCSCRRVDPYLSIYLIRSCIFLKKLSRGKASTAWSMLLSMSKLNLVMTTVVAYSPYSNFHFESIGKGDMIAK